MRFAISTSQQRTTWAWLSEVWQIADRLDVFESGWLFDHFYPLFGDSTEDCLEGWITLTALLSETERLRGGVLVTGMVYRHPAVLANMVATLDHTSGGRVELGLGAGWNEEECDAYGIELGTIRERFDRFGEGLEVIARLLDQDRATFDGQYFKLVDAMNNPKGVQAHIPVCIGGNGERRTLPLVARYADHWNYGSTDPSIEEFGRKLARLDECCDEVGRDRSAIEVSVLVRAHADRARISDEAEAYAGAGADIALVALAKSEPASAVESIAAALVR